jgi:hypothetical protein
MQPLHIGKTQSLYPSNNTNLLHSHAVRTVYLAVACVRTIKPAFIVNLKASDLLGNTSKVRPTSWTREHGNTGERIFSKILGFSPSKMVQECGLYWQLYWRTCSMTGPCSRNEAEYTLTSPFILLFLITHVYIKLVFSHQQNRPILFSFLPSLSLFIWTSEQCCRDHYSAEWKSFPHKIPSSAEFQSLPWTPYPRHRIPYNSVEFSAIRNIRK